MSRMRRNGRHNKSSSLRVLDRTEFGRGILTLDTVAGRLMPMSLRDNQVLPIALYRFMHRFPLLSLLKSGTLSKANPHMTNSAPGGNVCLTASMRIPEINCSINWVDFLTALISSDCSQSSD